MTALQTFQRLVDDVSSVSSCENGRWRYKTVWEPKLQYIEEDLSKGLDLEVIRDKYDLYEAADEVLEWREANLLLPSVADEVRRVSSLVAQVVKDNELQRQLLAARRSELSQKRFDEEVAAYSKVQTTLRTIGDRCSSTAALLTRATQELPGLEDLRSLLVKQRELAAKVAQCRYAFRDCAQAA